jgi:hypothetical protein
MTFSERRYLTDDVDIADPPMELRLFMGENGDWYVTIVPVGEKFSRHCVRVTTSGTKRPGMPAAVAALWRAMGTNDSVPLTLTEQAVEVALDAALAEVRRQGGPEYLLNEARSEGEHAARVYLRNQGEQT